MYKNLFLHISALVCSITFNKYDVHSQNYEYLKSIGTKNTITQVVDICISNNNSVFALLAIKSDPGRSDTIRIDSFQLVKPLGIKGITYLLKLNSKGQLQDYTSVGEFTLTDMTSDSKGNIYLSGGIQGNQKVMNSVLTDSSGGMVLCKLDSSFNLIWLKQAGKKRSIISSLKLIANRLYIIASSDTGKLILGKDSFSFEFGIVGNIYGEISTQNGMFKWAHYLYKGPVRSDDLIITGFDGISDHLYISGYLEERFNAIIKGDTFFGGGSFVIQLDSVGQYIKGISLHNRHYVYSNCLSSDGQNLYFGGFMRDTLNWFGKKILPDFPPNKILGNGPNRELFMASLDANLNPRWFLKPKILDTTRWTSFNQIKLSTYNNGFVYFGGSFGADIEVQGFKVTANFNSLLFCKVDSRGNVLWLTDGGDNAGLINIDAIVGKSVYACGSYTDTITFGPFTRHPLGQVDGFICKITDYDITRGPVNSGPYCAGDTILVPYTHIGDFDTSNYFIAELSDEYGSFDGGQRELGRIKTNLDSVVPGILPLFQVASSNEYRIRIRSTAPAIQSYYILDSLRLLIYSRDKANPGPTDTICYRDTTVLETFGGTKWSWSPAYHMDDSSLRTPRVWPEMDTVYRIIIADSSGCGAPDTAYKQIVVKPRPRLFGDTIVYKCPGVFLRVKLFVTNSDSGHTIRWYRNNKLYFTGDSMFYVEDANTTFTAVLNDHCSPVKDTFFVRVFYNPPSALLPFADTTVCFNASVALSALATGGHNNQYNWFDSKNNFIGQGSPVANLVKADSFKVVLSDACSSKADSAWKRIFLLNRIYPQMDAILQDDTLFCHDFSLNLMPSGVHSMDTVRWTNAENNSLLSSAQTLTVNTATRIAVEIQNICGTSYDSIIIEKDSIPQLWLDSLYEPCQGTALTLNILGHSDWKFRWSNADSNASTSIESSGNFWAAASNRCGADSAFFAVQFIPKPKAMFLNSDVCEGETFALENTGSGGQSFFWRLGDGSVSTSYSPTHQYARTRQARTYLVSLLATASKDCADSITLPVNVLASPDADFKHSSQGKTVFFTPIETPSGASYRWHFGDGDSSSLAAPSHTYKADSGTYTVCLKVTNAEGCDHVICKQVHFNVSVAALQKSGFVLFPNPTDGEVHIRFKESGLYHIEISDVLGRIVYTSEISQTEHTLQMPMKGTYFIKVSGNGISGIEKLVVW